MTTLSCLSRSQLLYQLSYRCKEKRCGGKDLNLRPPRVPFGRPRGALPTELPPQMSAERDSNPRPPGALRRGLYQLSVSARKRKKPVTGQGEWRRGLLGCQDIDCQCTNPSMPTADLLSTPPIDSVLFHPRFNDFGVQHRWHVLRSAQSALENGADHVVSTKEDIVPLGGFDLSILKNGVEYA